MVHRRTLFLLAIVFAGLAAANVVYLRHAAGSTLDDATLRAHLRASLAPYKIPSEIRFMSPLPAAPTGKLLKGVMKTMAQQAADATTASAAP